MPFPPPGDLPNPGIEPQCPVVQADSLLTKPPGKPKNTGVGSLSLLQGIFLTQELNQGLLHCRQILYQLRYQGSPELYVSIETFKYVHIYRLPLKPPHLFNLKALCKRPSDINCDSSCWCTRLDVVFLHIYLHFTLKNSNKRSAFVAPPCLRPGPSSQAPHTVTPTISSPQFCPNSLWCWEPWGMHPCKPW